ncbi:MAG: hypothetical protein GX210_06275 [Firmicutes bacterium]|nr:hypothetical protein [Bacillota bacterium]
MLKGKGEQIQMAFMGLFIGFLLGGLIFKGHLGGILGSAIGMAILLVVVVTLLKRHENEEAAPRIMLAAAGIVPGVLIGGSSALNLGAAGGTFFTLFYVLFFWIFLFNIIEGHKEEDRYLAYPAEYLIITLFSFAGVWIGSFISSLVRGILPDTAFFNGLSYLLFTLAFSILLPLSIGFIFAANRFRPLLGGLLALLGGGLVLWVGISIAPMLFLPGSGLYLAGLVFGSLMLALSLMAFFTPPLHRFIGCALMAISVLSYVGAMGGVIIGGILGIIGGALVFSWNGLEQEAARAISEEESFLVDEA